MGVTAERYSRGLETVRQGFAVARLVAQEVEAAAEERAGPSWLATAQPGTLRRYRTPLHAVRNILRMTKGHPNYHAYILRHHDGEAMGIGTLITKQWIMGPAPPDGEVKTYREVTDADYWLLERFKNDEELHGAAADELLRLSGNLALARSGSLKHPTEASRPAGASDAPSSLAYADRLITVVPEGHPNPPYGLMDSMEPMGLPTTLATPPFFTDTYDIVKGGQTSQLYYRITPLSA